MDKDLIEKYFRKQCSAQEAQRVEEWLRTIEGERFLAEEIDRDFRVIDEFDEELGYAESPSDQIFSEITNTINKNRSHTDRSVSFSARAWVGIAAAMILSLFVVLFVFQQYEHVEKEQQPYPKVITTTADSDTTVTFSDGSVVNLEKNSELTVTQSFTKKRRSVSLEGKAYFEVENDSNRPFLVHTDYSYIQVLGTKFEVEAYAGMTEVIVKVDEGKVRFFSKDNRVEPIDLVSNESGIMRLNIPEEEFEERGNINTENYKKPLLVRHRSLEKEDPKIKFVDNRLFVALGYLERQYNVDIELKNDSLRDTRFSITTDQSLLGAVKRIADSLDLVIEFDRKEDKLLLLQKE